MHTHIDEYIYKAKQRYTRYKTTYWLTMQAISKDHAV